MIGQLIARGGYTFEQVARMSTGERMFIHYHQGLSDQSKMRTLLKALGVIWDKSDFISTGVEETDHKESVSNEVFIPLAMTINPAIHKHVSDTSKKTTGNSVSKFYGNGDTIEGSLGKVRSMSELSKEDFYKMISYPIPSKLKKAQSLKEQKQT